MSFFNDNRVARFVLVGIVNTVVGFGLLNIGFFVLGLNRLVASIFATSIALIVSFGLNRGFVFNDKDGNTGRQIMSFATITLLGTVIFLNVIYAIILKLLEGHEAPIISLISRVSSLNLSKNFIDINFSTAIMTIAAMFWNYNGYRLFVFNKSPEIATSEDNDK